MCAHSYSNKRQERALSPKQQFLSKQVGISGKTALFAMRSLSQYLDTCSNPLKTRHAVKSLPPHTCHNLCEQHRAMPKAPTSREAHPSWHGCTSRTSRAGRVRGWGSPPGTPLVSAEGNSVPWLLSKPAHFTSTALT